MWNTNANFKIFVIDNFFVEFLNIFLWTQLKSLPPNCQVDISLGKGKATQQTNVKKSVLKMASLRSPSSPSDGYKRFSDDFANTSINNYGSNVTSKREAMIFLCTVAAKIYVRFFVITIHFVFHLTIVLIFSCSSHLTWFSSV